MNYSVKTPILMIIFNRPEVSLRTLSAIRDVRPSKLYIVADGPREGRNEDELCQKTRDAVMSGVDWECEVKSNFSEENLGCKKRVSSGIKWGFDKEPELIILEDDCLPSLSFFKFCDEMLEKYRNDERVMMVTGSNLVKDFEIDNDYCFSKYGSIWGWASWSRAFEKYDIEMNKMKERIDAVNSLSFLEKILWKNLFTEVLRGKFNTWDYQWDFTRFINSGLSVVPKLNLISNIGYGEGSTHTTNEHDPYANLKTHDLSFPLKAPSVIDEDKQYQKKYFKQLVYLDHVHAFKVLIKTLLRKLGLWKK